jgi:hypothetical protein
MWRRKSANVDYAPAILDPYQTGRIRFYYCLNMLKNYLKNKKKKKINVGKPPTAAEYFPCKPADVQLDHLEQHKRSQRYVLLRRRDRGAAYVRRRCMRQAAALTAAVVGTSPASRAAAHMASTTL